MADFLFSAKVGLKSLKNVVLNVPEIEQKVRDATSNEAWGASGTLLREIAEATWHYEDFRLIMELVWKRMDDNGKYWRHVYKSLTLLEYLLRHGSDRVVDETKGNLHRIRTLQDFQYVDDDGKDQGINVRERAKKLLAFVQSDSALAEERDKASNSKQYGAISSDDPRSLRTTRPAASERESSPEQRSSRTTYSRTESGSNVESSPPRQVRRPSFEDEPRAKPTSAPTPAPTPAKPQTVNLFDFDSVAPTTAAPAAAAPVSFDAFGSSSHGHHDMFDPRGAGAQSAGWASFDNSSTNEFASFDTNFQQFQGGQFEAPQTAEAQSGDLWSNNLVKLDGLNLEEKKSDDKKLTQAKVTLGSKLGAGAAPRPVASTIPVAAPVPTMGAPMTSPMGAPMMGAPMGGAPMMGGRPAPYGAPNPFGAPMMGAPMTAPMGMGMGAPMMGAPMAGYAAPNPFGAPAPAYPGGMAPRPGYPPTGRPF